MAFKISKKWKTAQGAHSQPKAMSHYLTAAANHFNTVAATGASNWSLLTSPTPPGLGLNVKYETKVSDVFTTAASLQQFADELPNTFGVALTPKEISDAGTFGALVDLISAKQLLG